MYNDYTFEVMAADPSGFLSYQSGKASSSLKFVMSCEYAEEFALRQMGKFWTEAAPSPVLPVPFPFDEYSDQHRGFGRMNLVATGFSIEPLSAACFGNNLADRAAYIGDPADINTMALYFKQSPAPEEEQPDNSCCECIVTLTYEENPCDCCGYDNTSGASPTYREWVAHSDILPGTCVSVERNPAYEMLTLPNGNLVWRDLPSTTIDEQRARQLKADSYAYKIIPKADIIVSWHNVPIRNICAIENHLRGFRGTVNDLAWGNVLSCDAAPVAPTACGCGQYEPETIMFIDFQEDRSKRTDAFGGNLLIAGVPVNNMNTTTLKLIFKQKRIERPTPTASYSDSDECPDDNDEAYGWNHLFFDRNTEDESPGEWMRVAIDNTAEDPLFALRSFSDIMYPVL
jgi:hypothetical protein